MLNLSKYIIVLVIVLIIIIALLFQNKNPELRMDIILGSINNIKDISVVQYHYEKIVKLNKAPNCNMTVIIKGNVEGFLNLNKVHKEDIKIKDSIVYIYLPDVELRFNLIDYRIFKEFVLFNCNRIELLNEAISKGKNLIIKEAKKDSIEEKTRERVREILRNLIMGFGFKDVIFIKDSLRL
jgi:hypothetical protein